ncbi:hypothetical protein ACHAQH_010070 [Verticillium albo-atrum]
MRFSLLKSAVTALAVCGSTVFGQITPSQVVDNIRTLTVKSQALQGPAQSITILNGPLLVRLLTGFADISATATAAIAQMQGMPKVPAGSQSDAIFNAFREFVRVHQVLLNILIGKAGLFNTVPLIGQPVAAALRSIENVVDTAAFMLIDNVESRADDLEAQAGMLKGTITIAIDSYDGLSL